MNTGNATGSALNRVATAMLNHVRHDGPIDAPLCYLTMEDGSSDRDMGEDYPLDDPLKLEKCFIKSGHWEPKTVDDLAVDIGQNRNGLTMKLSKMSCSILFGDISRHTEYSRSCLYLHNEHNIKFYPVGKNNANSWSIAATKAFGMCLCQYRRACLEWRNAAFFRSNVGLSDDKFLVMVNHESWMPVVKELVNGVRVVDHGKYGRQSTKLLRLNDRLVGCVIPLLAYISDQAISDLGQFIRKERPDIVRIAMQAPLPKCS
ncbi:hypothetical protein GGQ74_000001 [Desulfobaculum xiamenense]|uniref:Uncharacterized protein n=1 Tax=Desulfobaculum xiamenense TaxID=995050 RepID=A0A846QDH8_9BACT|nr:hypothetical protein [Desulfobaculum xiamenense]NJB66361.1 hypothetical protein [Desulfobaculum xiamenense]